MCGTPSCVKWSLRWRAQTRWGQSTSPPTRPGLPPGAMKTQRASGASPAGRDSLAHSSIPIMSQESNSHQTASTSPLRTGRIPSASLTVAPVTSSSPSRPSLPDRAQSPHFHGQMMVSEFLPHLGKTKSSVSTSPRALNFPNGRFSALMATTTSTLSL